MLNLLDMVDIFYYYYHLLNLANVVNQTNTYTHIVLSLVVYFFYMNKLPSPNLLRLVFILILKVSGFCHKTCFLWRVREGP